MRDKIINSIKFITKKDKAEYLVIHDLLNSIRNELSQKQSTFKQTTETLNSIKDIFNLSSIPFKWNAFDNSHISGNYCNGAVISWQNGEFIKNEYRKYNFANGNGDDYLMMYQMMFRRLNEIKKNPSIKPDILLIDGGAGQGNVVQNVMKEVQFFIPFICISKGPDRIDGNEKYYFCNQGDLYEVEVQKKSNERLLMQLIRDEVHRFAISNTRRKMLSNIN